MSLRIPMLVLLVVGWVFQSASSAQAAIKRVSHSYPVGEILATFNQEQSADSAKAEQTTKEGKPAQDKLIDLIVSTVQPDTWRQNGGRGRISYEPVSMTLIVHQTPAVHDEIANLLAALERSLDLQVAVEIRLLRVSEACFERLGVNFEPAGDEHCVKTLETRQLVSETTETSEGLKTVYRPLIVSRPIPTEIGKAFLTDSEVRELFATAQGDRRTNIMQAPKLTLLNSQTGVVEIAETQYFVTNLNLDFQNGQVITKPTQAAFKFGTRFTIQPTVSADRKSILVHVNYQQTNLSGPVPLIPVQIPVKKLDQTGKEKSKPELLTLFLQQPHVNTLAIENTSVIPDGQTLLLGGIKTMAEERNEFGPPVLSKIPYLNRIFKTVGYGRETVFFVIMVTPRIIVQEEEKQVPTPTSY